MRRHKATGRKARLKKQEKRRRKAQAYTDGRGRPAGYSPLPPDQEPRTEIIQIRFRPSERAVIEKEAKTADLTVSEWIRQMTLGA